MIKYKRNVNNYIIDKKKMKEQKSEKKLLFETRNVFIRKK